MKRHVQQLLCLLLVFSLLSPQHASASPNGSLTMEVHNHSTQRYEPADTALVNLLLNGSPLSSDVPAVIWQSRTMVPVRLLSEVMGISVGWNDEDDQVILQWAGQTIVLTLGSATALVNGRAYPLPDGVPATVMRLSGVERTMVPVRFVSEQLGCSVEWRQDSYTVAIRTPSSGAVTGIQADSNAQTVLISTDRTPHYVVQDFSDRVVLDLIGFSLADGFPGSIPVDNELISKVRYAEHDDSLYSDYSSTVRVVLDLKEGITYKDNVSITSVGNNVVLTTYLPNRDTVNFTPTSPLDPSKKTIVLDPGHGGSAPGAIYSGIAEKDINLSVALKLEQRLRSSGYNVVLTRSADTHVGLYERADIANALEADIFVSLHSNASLTNLQATGIYTYYHPTSRRGARLAQAIQTPVTRLTGASDRGIEKADFVVLRETDMCAVLVEVGFMSTPGELMLLVNDSYQDKLAAGIAEGIVRYLNTQ